MIDKSDEGTSRAEREAAREEKSRKKREYMKAWHARKKAEQLAEDPS